MSDAPKSTIRSLRDWLNDGDTDSLIGWAAQIKSGASAPWFALNNAWRACSNKDALSWPVLQECLTVAYSNEALRSQNPLLALEALSFRPAADSNPANAWTCRLDPINAHAMMEQAVTWRTEKGHGASYFDECLLSSTLMQLSIECKQGRIWREHIQLYEYPLEPALALAHTEMLQCTDPVIYAAMAYYQNITSTLTGWKRQCLENNQWHNLTQLSNTPFVAAEYVIDQHAQHDNQKTYAEIIEKSLFELVSGLSPTDTWMLAQLKSPDGDWNLANCPDPANTQLKSWWYSLLLGVDDAALLHSLHPDNAPASEWSLPLPTNFSPL